MEKTLDEIKKDIEEFDNLQKKFNREDIDEYDIMMPSIKPINATKFMIELLNEKIKESNLKKREERNRMERLYLFDCRDIMLVNLMNLIEHEKK
jgi:hypothetical protein